MAVRYADVSLRRLIAEAAWLLSRSLILAALIIPTQARGIAGQGITVRGVVYDSLHSRPLYGAFVSIGARSSTSDSAGRFAISGVAPGVYRLTAQHDAIDSLGLSAIGTQVVVDAGDQFVQVAIPSFAQLWRLACGADPPERDTGFVFGTIRGWPRAQAVQVAASWIDLVAKGKTVSQKLVTLEVGADSLGNFALCGVPTNTGFTVHASARDSLRSGTFDVPPLGQERVVRRDLDLIDQRTKGTGAVTGRVLADSGGQPIADAEVVLNAALTTRSNSRGEYAFTDLLPGSYHLNVRKIGYAEVNATTDVGPGQSRNRDIILSRVTVLDSMAVTGKRLARDEQMRVFEEHRRVGLGKFLTVEELDKARGMRISSLIRQWPGIYFPPARGGTEPNPVSTRGIKTMSGASCGMQIYLDGVKLSIPLAHVAPETLAGLEYYPGPSTTPAEYAYLNNTCGVIILHSRYKTGK